MKVAAIVPSLNPDEKFREVVESLIAVGFKRIYLVNDGSTEDRRHFFDEAAERPECIVIHHEVNCGKGRALKTALDRYLSDGGDYVGAVTADGDGQHHAEDVVQVALALEKNPESLILGVRDFSKEDVPARSEFGNKVTRSIFRILCGISVTDTQTGLRGIPNDFARELLEVDGERYEFETNMLLETKRAYVPMVEVPISTIYIEDNAASHFRPIMDSMRIYRLIFRHAFKYAFSSLACAFVDYTLFGILNHLLRASPSRLIISVACARVCSALLNFFINKNVVFRSKANNSMLRYFLLSACIMLCSYSGIRLLSEFLSLPDMSAKVITDVALFAASFTIQREWVFKAKK